MSTEIETPEAMAARVLREAIEAESPGPRNKPNAHNCIVAGVVADREQIAAWCAEHEKAAKGEGDTHPDEHRSAYCDGQASALRALVAILRGAK